jgi:GNAT superfamily N-acetyltransferase
MKIKKDDYYISDESSDVNISSVKKMLSETYWANKRPLETIKKSINHSVCFSLYEKDQQIGFARVVTDYSTCAYLADVTISKEYRGKGLGKWFIETIVNDERWRDTLIMLGTKDAHKLYEQYGFRTSEALMKRPNKTK